MLEIKGLDELIKKLEKIEHTPEKITKKALKEAGDHVKKVEVAVAKAEHHRYSENVGWKEIKKYGVRSKKGGSQVIDIGLKGRRTAKQKKQDAKNKKLGKSRPTHWDKIKGLWFNNYGFYHNRTKQYVSGSNWIGKAYKESSDQAYNIIRDELLKEMGLK